MFSRRSFTLTELLIAVVLTGLIILAVTSVDITSRKFFGAASKEAQVQDEAKIAMEHIVKYVQQGIGDMTNPPDSRGFTIFDNSSPATSGSRIRIKLDYNGDGRFTGSPDDRIIQYSFDAGNHRIIYYPDIIGKPGDSEPLTGDMVYRATFTAAGAPNHNQVKVEIIVRQNPTENPGPDNPGTTLTSDVVLRAMSCN